MLPIDSAAPRMRTGDIQGFVMWVWACTVTRRTGRARIGAKTVGQVTQRFRWGQCSYRATDPIYRVSLLPEPSFRDCEGETKSGSLRAFTGIVDRPLGPGCGPSGGV